MTVLAKVWAKRFTSGYCKTCHSERSRRISRILDWTCSTCPLKTNLCADAWPVFRPPLYNIRAKNVKDTFRRIFETFVVNQTRFWTGVVGHFDF